MSLADLFQKLADGDSSARDPLFRELYVSFRILARHRIAGWDDAEEVVQTAIVKASTKMDQLTDKTKFSAWAHRILKNEVIEFQRRKQRDRQRHADVDAGSLTLCSDPVDSDLRTRLKDCLQKINAVSGRHARILSLRYQGYGTEDICERLSLTSGNLYVLLHRARTMLRTCLESGEVHQ